MLKEQMEMFEEGGLKDDGGTIDPISGNDVPSGSTQEEVRDDIPAQLSEGEFVFPADVVRYIGLQNLMQMRQQAKMGLKEMEDMGQMGNSEEATMPDDMPFDINDIDMQDEEEYNSNTEENMEMAKGGVVYAATGFSGTTTNAPGLTMKKSSFDNTAARKPTPEYKAPPTPTAAPSGGFKYGTGNKTETTTSYDKLVGGVGADEYRTYVNDAGAEIQVPFKSGQMLTGYNLPVGYRPKVADKVDTSKIQSARAKSTRPSADTNDNDNNDGVDTALGGARVDIGGVTYAIQYNFDGSVGLADVNKSKRDGSVSFNKVTPETAGMIKDMTIGQVAEIAKSLSLKGVVVNELAKGLGVKLPYVDKVEKSIAKTKDIVKTFKTQRYNDTFDLKDSNVAKSRSVEDDIVNIDKDERIDQDIKSFEPVSRSDYRDATAKRLSDSSPTSDENKPTGDNSIVSGTYATSKSFGEANNDDGSTSTTGSTSSSGDTGFGGGYGATYKGSFITRNQPSKKKIKKMKRGGLASRK